MGFHKTAKPTPKCTQTSLVPPRYHNIVQASSNTTDTSIPPLSLTFVGVIESHPYSKPDPFSYSADLEAVERGLEVFRSGSLITNHPSNVAKKDIDHLGEVKAVETDKIKIAELEAELKQMHENYQRLAAIHKQTWEEHAKWRLEVETGKEATV